MMKLPHWITWLGWSRNSKGYLIYTSRKANAPFRRGTRAHRAVMAKLTGRELQDDEVVHHQDFDKLNCLPSNLILMPACFNPTGAMRCPYTGRMMSVEEYRRNYA